jgi:hypothetical protein
VATGTIPLDGAGRAVLRVVPGDLLLPRRLYRPALA